MYNEVIYFILEHTDRIDSQSKTSTIELRRLLYPPATVVSSSSKADTSVYDTEADKGRCTQLFSSTVTRESYFNVIECSKLLSVVSRETFQKFTSYQSFEGLLVLPASDGGLNFYLQVIERVV